ncbi:hypothetical protein F2P79_024296 [Pimephales promelas]|nr:hypothetical protein F2P79_024296 [Pimephales promelas]
MRKKIISQIAALRDTNPAVPLVSTLDLLPEIEDPDVPLNEDVEECSNPDCKERVEKLRLENSNLNQSVDTLTTALRDITRRYRLLKKRPSSDVEPSTSQQPPSFQEPESPPDHGVTLNNITEEFRLNQLGPDPSSKHTDDVNAKMYRMNQFLTHMSEGKTRLSTLIFLNETSRIHAWVASLCKAHKKETTIEYYVQNVSQFLNYVCETPPPSCRLSKTVLIGLRREMMSIRKSLKRKVAMNRTAFPSPPKPSYYCEAILVFRHAQCPRAVEALMGEEWVNRTVLGERIVVALQGDKASKMQIAITKEEQAFLELYFCKIRPENLQPQKYCESFFVSSDGEAVQCVSRDISRLHELYEMAPFTSQCVRRAVEAAAKNLPAQQKGALLNYMAPSSGFVNPQDVMDAAQLLESLASESETSLATSEAAGGSRRDFVSFLERFPVSLDGLPPSKKLRMESGFPEDHAFSDKWRANQYAQREKYLLSYFTLRKPTAAEVARLIAREGWTMNCPRPDNIERQWRPAPKKKVEEDEFIIRCVTEQTWTGLVIKNFGAEQGLGVVATRPFCKDDIVCDYHGKVVTAEEGRAIVQSQLDEPGYVFFF